MSEVKRALAPPPPPPPVQDSNIAKYFGSEPLDEDAKGAEAFTFADIDEGFAHAVCELLRQRRDVVMYAAYRIKRQGDPFELSFLVRTTTAFAGGARQALKDALDKLSKTTADAQADVKRALDGWTSKRSAPMDTQSH